MKKKKRGVGIRSNILLDSTDLAILNYLDTNKTGSLLELAKKLDISYKSLKPHFDKLNDAKLVFYYRDDNNDDCIHVETIGGLMKGCLNKPEYEKDREGDKQRLYFYERFIHFLKKIEENLNKERDDLREKKNYSKKSIY